MFNTSEKYKRIWKNTNRRPEHFKLQPVDLETHQVQMVFLSACPKMAELNGSMIFSDAERSSSVRYLWNM